jgi:hemerythrin-like domain-containing protein
MQPTETLKHEHRVIERVLAVLERASDKLARNEAVDVAVFTQAVDFIRNFADRCHHAKEEDNLFRRMGERGFPYHDGPIAVMLAEHDQGRQYVRGLAEAAERYGRGDAAATREIIANARGFSQLLAQHIQKEDTILYVMADNVLSPADQRDLAERFERLEQEIVGPGGHERYVALVDDLERAVGITAAHTHHH